MRTDRPWYLVIAAAVLALGTASWHISAARGQPQKAKPFLEVPDTVSPIVREYLERFADPSTQGEWPASDDVAGWKREWEATEAANEPAVQATLKRYQPTVSERKIGGVPVVEVKPKGWKDNGKVLVHTHGGAYTLFSAHSRLTSSAVAANATGLRVISIDYTVAPTGKWDKVTDEVLAVFAGLQKEGMKLKDIAIYGESAGGAIAAGAVLKMRDKDLGMPAAVVLWSPWADITNRGDSAITMRNYDPYYVYEKHLKHAADAYAAPEDQKHPYVSPVYGDYTKGFPSTLVQGGTRELFLSHCVRQYRAIDSAGGEAVLDLYEGMPHVFQMRLELAESPETRAALKKMTTFLKKQLGY